MFWCGHFQRQQWVYHVTASWVPDHINTITLGDTIIPLVRSKGSPPRTNDLTRPPAIMIRPKKQKKVPWFSSIASDWRVLQRLRQPTPTQSIYYWFLTRKTWWGVVYSCRAWPYSYDQGGLTHYYSRTVAWARQREGPILRTARAL